MRYIHERPDWPDFRWDLSALAEPLAAVRYRQGLLLVRMSTLGFYVRSEAGLAAMTTDVVKSSAIEGERLDVAQVRSSLARRLGLEMAGMVPSGRNVDGVVEMMLDATQHYDEPLTVDRLCGWHSSLFPAGYGVSGRIVTGKWRTAESGPMQVVSGYIGREKVHFEAPAAERLDLEMRRFLEWFNAPLSIDPILRAGVAHLWFVTIHPFEDGNGRIARAIADCALASADGCRQRFYSMSGQIEHECKEYYSILEYTQKGSLDITSWLGWFVDCLGRAIAAADDTLASVVRRNQIWSLAGACKLNDRQRTVINRLLDDFKGNLTSGKYAKLAKCSPDTALRDIKELLEYGLLEKGEGGGRSTSYALAAVDSMRETAKDITE